MDIIKLKNMLNGYQHIKEQKDQMAAVQQYGDALQYCANPSEAVMLAAVQQNGDALQYCTKFLQSDT